MIDKRKFYINGQWVSPSKPNDYEVINPSTEEAFATISLGSTATRSINAGRYVYDVLVVSGMTVYRIVDGNILVRGGVSSAP